MRYKIERLDPALSVYRYRGTLTLKDRNGVPCKRIVFGNSHKAIMASFRGIALSVVELLAYQSSITVDGGWIIKSNP